MNVKRLILFFVLLLFIPLFLAASAQAGQGLPDGDAVVGGRIYDNWFNILDASAPESSHPLWASQETNTREGAVTWRCATCHGWDYKGADGAFGEHSEGYTGFPGIMSVIGQSNDEIRGWLDGTKNPEHDFSPYLTKQAENDLIAFLRTRLIESKLLIDSTTRAALGSKGDGEHLYNTTCENCHGGDGEKLNMGSVKNPEFLGDVAARHPWKFVHKVRFGHPGSKMPAADEEGWSLQQVTDVLAYAQDLPLAKPLTAEELNPGALPALDFSEQGNTTGITIIAIVMMLVIFGGTSMVLLRDRLAKRE